MNREVRSYSTESCQGSINAANFRIKLHEDRVSRRDLTEISLRIYIIRKIFLSFQLCRQSHVVHHLLCESRMNFTLGHEIKLVDQSWPNRENFDEVPRMSAKFSCRNFSISLRICQLFYRLSRAYMYDNVYVVCCMCVRIPTVSLVRRNI